MENTIYLRTAALVLIAASVLGSANADPIVWTGEGDTPAWSDGGNWKGGTAPGSEDTAVIPAGSTATWTQSDASFMNSIAGIVLNGDMEVSGMTAATTLTVPISGTGVFRGLEGGEKAPSISSGTYYYLTLNNNNENFTGTFAFTNCGVCVNNSKAFGSANPRCTVIWKNDTSGNHRRLYLMGSGVYNANMFLAQPGESLGMVFATCNAATYLAGDIDLIGPVQFNANNRPQGFHIRGKLTNSSKMAYRLASYVHLEGEVDLKWNSQSQYGGGFYLGGGNGNIKSMGHMYLNSGGIHFSAPNVIGGSDPGGLCYWLVGNENAVKLHLDGNDQNWYRKSYVIKSPSEDFIVDSTKPATLRMMNFGNNNQDFNTANCLTGYASFDVCATNKTGTKYTTTVKNTHCTTAGGLLCGAGTFVVGDSAAEDVTTSFSNLTSLVTYNTGTMKICNTAINPENGITNLSVLGTSKMTFASCVTQKTERAYLSSSAELTIPADGRVMVSKRTYLDGNELMSGVYGKVGGTYEDGTAIPPQYQLGCIKGDGYLETEGRKGMILSFR